MKLTIVTEVNLSEEAFALLLQIDQTKYAEYRDSDLENLEEFLKSEKSAYHPPTWYLARNFNGTIRLVRELAEKNLVESDHMAWHLTYKLTDFGKQAVEQYYNPIR